MDLIWKPVVGFEEQYLISNFGDVMSLPKKTRGGSRILKQGLRGVPSYPYVHLCKDGEVYKSKVSRLVAKAFLENPDDLPIVNHKDEDRMNSHVDNLEWCTAQYNVEYSTAKHYKLQSPSGELVEIFNLRKFSRELGIPHQYFFQLALRQRVSVKGWTLPN